MVLVPRAWGQTWDKIDYRVTFSQNTDDSQRIDRPTLRPVNTSGFAKVFESSLLSPAVHCTHLVANEKGIPIEDRLIALGLDGCRLIRRGASAST